MAARSTAAAPIHPPHRHGDRLAAAGSITPAASTMLSRPAARATPIELNHSSLNRTNPRRHAPGSRSHASRAQTGPATVASQMIAVNAISPCRRAARGVAKGNPPSASDSPQPRVR